MDKPKHTPRPYLRVENVVYALESIGFRRGEEQFQNRVYAGFQGGPNTPKEEVEATAAYFQKAVNCHDDLLAACKEAKELISSGNWEIDSCISSLEDSLDFAIAKAEVP